MAVLPRSTASVGDEGQVGSSRVSASLVVGMVLGVLCLFTMVVSYQLVSSPCKKRGLPATRRVPRSTIPPATHAPSKPKRSFNTLVKKTRDVFRPKPDETLGEKPPPETPGTPSPRRATVRSLYLTSTKPIRGLFHRAHEGESSPASDSSRTPPNLRERRALRSLYLNTRTPGSPRTPTKRYPYNPAETPTPTSPMRKRMGGLIIFNCNSPFDSPGSQKFLSPESARTRRQYKKLDESSYTEWSNEEVYRPASALISPWSPSEYEFPYPSIHSPGITATGEPWTPCTPPPLYPPPPAYIPEIPMRSPGGAPPSPACSEPETPRARPALPPPPPPLSPIVPELAEEILRDIVTWSDVRQQRSGGEAGGRHSRDGVFVISNESEDETSDVDSITGPSTVESAGTWEVYEV